jgi:hypothetical protein
MEREALETEAHLLTVHGAALDPSPAKEGDNSEFTLLLPSQQS